MRFALMIEGQDGVTWADWVALADACERLGFEALFRSDHYLTDWGPPGSGSLDAWGTVCALAARTSTLRLGTLVSPVTFREPSVLARLAVTADRISGGRVEMGIGTGWMEREHRAHGFPFPALKERMDRLAEQLEIITRSWAPGPFDFHGEHWTVEALDALPKPVQDPLPIVMGGAAGKRGSALAARYAAEYNVVHETPDGAAAARGRVRAACAAAGRDPDTMRFSLMHAVLIGVSGDDLRDRARRLGEHAGEPLDLDETRRDWIAGTPDEIVAKLRAYEAAGVERVMFQHLLFRDIETLELLAAEVFPAFA